MSSLYSKKSKDDVVIVQSVDSSSSSLKDSFSVRGSDCNIQRAKKLKALVVDDNPVNRKILRLLLTNLGVENQEAVNGQEAVDLYLAGSVFDVIFMDKDMPVMDGPKATKLLRSMGVKIKIVGVSSHTRPKDIQEFMDAGLDDFHAKPITRAKLNSIFEELKK